MAVTAAIPSARIYIRIRTYEQRTNHNFKSSIRFERAIAARESARAFLFGRGSRLLLVFSFFVLFTLSRRFLAPPTDLELSV